MQTPLKQPTGNPSIQQISPIRWTPQTNLQPQIYNLFPIDLNLTPQILITETETALWSSNLKQR